MANNWYLASALTGGAAGALDEIDGANLNDGDRAIAIIDGYTTFYILDDDNAGAEDSPFIISPDSNSGDKRWVLKKSYNPWFVTSDDEPAADANIISSTNSISFGRYCNIISSDYAAILFGENSTISESDYSVISGSANEIWDGYENLVLGGYQNIISGGDEESSILGGYKNKLIGSVSVIAGGDRNIIDANKAVIPGGKKARAYIDYQETFGIDNFSVEGDAQRSILIGKTTTTDASVSTSISTNFKLLGNRLWKFNIHLAAIQYAGTAGTVGDSAFWEITGGIKNTGGIQAQGSITFSGNPSASETLVFNGKTFTFLDKTEFLESKEIPITSTKNYFSDIFNREFKNYVAEFDYVNTVTITAVGTDAADNSLTFTESATNITIDGSGTFGGTTAGVNPTTAIVGTVQGTGTPGTNDRDTGAAAWSVAVTADNTNNLLQVSVTGEANKTIRWVAKVDLVEIGI